MVVRRDAPYGIQMSDLTPVRHSKKRSKTKKSRGIRIRPAWIAAIMFAITVLGLATCVVSYRGQLQRWAMDYQFRRSFESVNGTKASKVTPPDEQQPWRVFRDADGLFEIELKGWVGEGRAQMNGVNTRELYAFDAEKSQSFSVMVYQLKPGHLTNPSNAQRLIQDTQRDGFQNIEPQPFSWQGYQGFESKGMANPAVFKKVQPHFARDLVVHDVWVSLRAESPIGPYDEADALRAANSLKILRPAPQ